MHDFSCTDTADMYYATLADRVRLMFSGISSIPPYVYSDVLLPSVCRTDRWRENSSHTL